MKEIINKREFKKDIMLLLVGALLASIPTLISTYMQGESQLSQIILDRRIIALKDYSHSYNKIVSDLLPMLESFENKILNLYEKHFNGEKVNKEKLRELMIDFNDFINRRQYWIAQVNTNTLIINSLFDSNLPLNKVYYFDPLGGYFEDTNVDNIVESLKHDVVELKKSIVDMINREQEIMHELSYMIK